MMVLLNALQAGNRSGTGVYTTQLARWLPEVAGIDQIRIVWPETEPKPLLQSSHESAYVPVRVSSALSRLWYDQFTVKSLARRLGANPIHYPANVGSLTGAPNTVLTLHDLTFVREPQWYRAERALYYRMAARASALRARRIIAVSRATAQEIVECFRIPEDRIDVIYNGIGDNFRPADNDAKAAVRARYNLPEQFVLYVGTIEPRKNLVRLIRAWDRLPSDAKPPLVIAGRDGWKTGPVHIAADHARDSANIHFIGHVPPDQLPALMSAAYIFAFPSLYEGFGIPVAEAMACGTPVLTSNTSSLPEVAGDAALLVNPLDEEAITAGLHRLVADTALRETIRQRGLARAAEFSWRQAATQTKEAYQRTMDSGT